MKIRIYDEIKEEDVRKAYLSITRNPSKNAQGTPDLNAISIISFLEAARLHEKHNKGERLDEEKAKEVAKGFYPVLSIMALASSRATNRYVKSLIMTGVKIVLSVVFLVSLWWFLFYALPLLFGGS